MKCRLCSSGLYISMTAPLLTKACSSGVRVSGLAESSGKKKAVSSSKTFNCSFSDPRNASLMKSVRSRTEFLSDFLRFTQALRTPANLLAYREPSRQTSFPQFQPMIAISYRREDSTSFAARLHDRLRAELGQENGFMDFDSIRYDGDCRTDTKTS